MDARLVAERVVNRPTAAYKSVYSVIPSTLVKALGAADATRIIFEGTGRYKGVRVSGGQPSDPCGARLSRTRVFEIPPCAGLEAMDHDTLQWFITAQPGGKVGVHVSIKGPALADIAKPPAKPGKMGTVPLADTRVYRIRDKKYHHVQTTVPKICVDVLLARDASHIRWEKAGSYYRVSASSGGGADDRRLVRAANQKKNFSYVSYLPKEVASALYKGKGSRAEWHAAADGLGTWEIRVRGMHT